MRFFSICFVSLLSLFAKDVFADKANHGRFERAALAYENGDWPTAITTYNTILEDGVSSWAIHFNLGQSYFKNNEPGPAIFHLERAQILAPQRSAISELIAQVQEAFTVQNASLPAWKQWARWLTPNQWISLFSLGAWLALLSFLLRRIKPYAIFDSTGFHFTRISSVLGACVSMACFLVTRDWYHEAVITEDEVVLKLSPTDNSPEIRPIVAGEKAQVQKAARDHYYIVASDGSEGWVPEAGIRKLWM